MDQNRREFLTGAAWMGAAAMAAGCMSRKSVNARSAVVEFPDYTRGGWKTAKPFTVDEIDMNKFDFSKGVKKDADAQIT